MLNFKALYFYWQVSIEFLQVTPVSVFLHPPPYFVHPFEYFLRRVIKSWSSGWNTGSIFLCSDWFRFY
jgi:endoglucanase Acf2